jgi:nicotinamidase/pyrazinamidase
VVSRRDWHPEHTPHFKEDGGSWPEHCVANSRGAAFPPARRVPGETLQKGVGGEDGYSGYLVHDATSGDQCDTSLDTLLPAHAIGRVIVVGLATDYCVKETALDAIRLGFKTGLLHRAVGAVILDPGDEERAPSELEAAGISVG